MAKVVKLVSRSFGIKIPDRFVAREIKRFLIDEGFLISYSQEDDITNWENTCFYLHLTTVVKEFQKALENANVLILDVFQDWDVIQEFLLQRSLILGPRRVVQMDEEGFLFSDASTKVYWKQIEKLLEIKQKLKL